MRPMTMTLADAGVHDGVMGPRSDRPQPRVFTTEYKAQILIALPTIAWINQPSQEALTQAA